MKPVTVNFEIATEVRPRCEVYCMPRLIAMQVVQDGLSHLQPHIEQSGSDVPVEIDCNFKVACEGRKNLDSKCAATYEGTILNPEGARIGHILFKQS